MARPLTAKGRAQSQSISKRLKGLFPVTVLSSPYRRCIETVEPLAAKCGLSVIVEPSLGEGNGVQASGLIRLMAKQEQLPVVVMCSHGDVIPEILVTLADEDHLELGAAPRQEKGSVWQLQAEGGSFVKASYLKPGD